LESQQDSCNLQNGGLTLSRSKKVDEKRAKIYEFLPASMRDNSYAVHVDGITGIAPFNEAYPPKEGLSAYRMKLTCDILVLNEEKPFLAIELETSQDPQVVMGLIPLYMLTKWIKIRKANLDLNQFPVDSLLLIIVVPDLSDTLQEKWTDSEEKLKELIDLKENKLSTLKDFEICEISDFKSTLKKILINNGYEELATEPPCET
jgi:hypothetical protein